VGPAVKFTVLIAFALLLVAWATSGVAADSAHPSPTVAFEYHSVIPLGSDNLLLEPSKTPLFLLASAESRDFDGWRQVDDGSNHFIYGPDGAPVRKYPEFVNFRITASTKIRPAEEKPYPISCKEDVNDYLLGFRFQLKIFHGLDYTVLQPKAVRLIGMPSDVSYDERIYRVSFELPDLPLDDRLMLEIYSPTGDRISKFHLEFN
jgi:hypothetical protein